MRVQGGGFRVEGLGFRVQGLGFRLLDLVFASDFGLTAAGTWEPLAALQNMATAIRGFPKPHYKNKAVKDI